MTEAEFALLRFTNIYKEQLSRRGPARRFYAFCGSIACNLVFEKQEFVAYP